MISRRVPLFIASLSVLAGAATPLFAQDGDTGVIRGVVNDRDFDGPLPLAQVQVRAQMRSRRARPWRAAVTYARACVRAHCELLTRVTWRM